MGRRIKLKIELLQAEAEVGISNIDVAPTGTGMR